MVIISFNLNPKTDIETKTIFVYNSMCVFMIIYLFLGLLVTYTFVFVFMFCFNFLFDSLLITITTIL